MFKVAGVSRQKGEIKVRFANDMTRVKLLAKDGQTDINLLELPNEMEKGDAVKFLLTTELMQTPEFAEAIEAADEKYNSVKEDKKAALTGEAKKVKATSKKKETAETVDPEAKLADLQARAAAVAE